MPSHCRHYLVRMTKFYISVCDNSRVSIHPYVSQPFRSPVPLVFSCPYTCYIPHESLCPIMGPISSDYEPCRQTSSISRTVVGNKIYDHSDAIGASPVGTAPTTSSFSTEHLASVVWAKTSTRRDKKHLSCRMWVDLCWRFDSSPNVFHPIEHRDCGT